MKKFSIILVTVILALADMNAQARMVMQDSIFLRMDNGIYLILENKNSNALTQIGLGGNIISEDESNQIRWHIGDTTGFYFIPWMSKGVQAYKIPFECTITTAGIGTNGFMLFSTYSTSPLSNNSPWLSPVNCFDLNDCSFGPVTNDSPYAVDRWWVVDGWNYTTKPGLNMKLTYVNSEAAGSNTINQSTLKARRWNDNIYEWEPTKKFGSVTLGVNTSYVDSIIVSPADLFYSWILADSINTNPLPVTLLSFSTECSGGNVHLVWQTSSEVNNDYFGIEKSNNGIDFYEIGRVPGNGNANSLHNYEYFDWDQSAVYYRLKQVDFNGAFEYLGVEYTNCNNSLAPLEIYPNPSAGIFHINYGTEIEYAELSVSDAKGQVVMQFDAVNVKESIIDLTNYPSGVYFLTIHSNTNHQFFKLLKN